MIVTSYNDPDPVSDPTGGPAPGPTGDVGGDPTGGPTGGPTRAAAGGPAGATSGDPAPQVAAHPTEPSPGSTETDRVAAQLRAALGPLLRRLRQVRPDGELTMSQTSALVRLDRDGPATASELAAAEGIRPQSMFTIVGVLQERGLVAREQDPADGRRMVLSLTAAGRDGLLGARAERARRLAAAIDAELTAEERDRLAAAIPLLERITRRV